MIPIVIEKKGQYEHSYDIYSRLLMDDIIFINGEIDENVSASVVAQLLFLEEKEPDEGINLYINSRGGYVTSGLAIIDTMRYIKCDIRTLCIGEAASMAALILSSGTKGKRFSLPHSRIMIHQPSGGAFGKTVDIEIYSREISRQKDILNKILSDNTGKTIKAIEKATERDTFMDAEEAQKFGIIDGILENKE